MKKDYLEMRVGMFVLIALLVAGFLIVAFGRFGEMFQTTYPLTLEFESANGIIKNSQVLYRGANVGKVASKPMIADGGKRAELLVQINSDVEIDREATFRIGSYGLLGDRFVDVVPPEEPSGSFYESGDRAHGSRTTGIGELAEELKPVIDRMETIIAELDDQDVAGQISESVAKMNSVLEKVDAIMGEAAEGKGAFHTLMKDPTVADDLKTTIREFRLLSQNLRQKGILFYSDLSKKKESGEAQEMSPLIRDRLK
jgi:phospholipid/cholesterol/gamma-HCH transport system substrate-binding protein